MNTENNWLTDANGNRCSTAYFGSREAAQAALDSLVDCKNCRNCSRCSGCFSCFDCSGCFGCSGVASQRGKRDLKDNPSNTDVILGQPPIPVIDRIHARVLEEASKPGALNMSRWHTCDTTHCRAGLVVHLAGEAGYALERFHNTPLAAQPIYRESSPDLPVSPVRFYESDAEAMADMRAMAEKEAAQKMPKTREVQL